jgi:hypothetical protein
MAWDEIVKTVAPYVVKIDTPSGHGTGFVFCYSEDMAICGIATARHVVNYADQWQQPVRLNHHPTATSALLKEDDRFIDCDEDTDSAVIIFPTRMLNELPKEPLPLLANDETLPTGAEVGWLGYPGIAALTLCFFSGIISARIPHGYLIDGVAINGVSGGPVVSYWAERNTIQIVGTVSAYAPNRATGDALPGLSVAQDISHFHESIAKIKSLDEANKKKQIEEAGRQAAASTAASSAAPAGTASGGVVQSSRERTKR